MRISWDNIIKISGFKDVVSPFAPRTMTLSGFQPPRNVLDEGTRGEHG